MKQEKRGKEALAKLEDRFMFKRLMNLRATSKNTKKFREKSTDNIRNEREDLTTCYELDWVPLPKRYV